MQAKSLTLAVEHYCAWYKLVRTWALLQYLLFAAAATMALLVAADKLVFFNLDYALAGYVAGALALAGLLIGYAAMPRRRAYVSYLVDQRLGLKNLVSSGLEVAGREDEVSRLVAARAEAAVRRPELRRVLPLSPNWAGRYLVLPVIALVALYFLPAADWFGRRAAHEQLVAEQEAVQQSRLVLLDKMSKIEERLKSTSQISNKQITQDLKALEKDLLGQDKQSALLKLGEFEERYQKELGGERKFEEATRNLSVKLEDKALAPESRDAMQELVKDLKKNDFAKAAEELRKLAEQMQGDKLNEQQKQALAKNLQDLAKQLQGNEAADQLAKNLQNMQASNVDPQQAQQQQDQGQQAADAMNKLANSMQEMQSLKEMREGLEGAKKEMVGDSFKNFDAKAVEDMMAAEAEQQAGLGTCPNCGQGDCPGAGGGEKEGTCPGKGKGNGPGTGGEGQGRGGNPPEQQTNVSFKDELYDSRVNKGKILNQLYVYGVPEKGEVTEEYVNAVRAAQQDATSSLARNKVPREYEDAVKGYFDSLAPKKDAP